MRKNEPAKMPSAHTGENGDQERQDESEKFKE